MLGRYGVVSAATPRVAAADALQSDPAAGKGALHTDGFERIGGTTGSEPATPQWAEQGRLGRRQRPAIKPDAEYEDVLKRIH